MTTNFAEETFKYTYLHKTFILIYVYIYTIDYRFPGVEKNDVIPGIQEMSYSYHINFDINSGLVCLP